MDLKFRPARFPVIEPAQKIFATYDSVGIIAENGKVYYLNDKFIDDSDVEETHIVSDDEKLKNGVLEIGGTYKLRYALVRN